MLIVGKREEIHPHSTRDLNPGPCSTFIADYRHAHVSLKVPNVEFDVDIRFSTLMHGGKTKRRKPNIEMEKLGRFYGEDTYTILT